MSIQMVGAVLKCGPQDRTQFCIMMVLANYADHFGFLFAGIELIAAESRCDYTTAKRQLNALEASGWLCVHRKTINGKANSYSLNTGKLGVAVPSDLPRSAVFTRLLKQYGGVMTPVFAPDKSETLLDIVPSEPFFAPEKSEGTDQFSGGDPQGSQGADSESQGANDPVSEGIACPPNRKNRQGTVKDPSVVENHSPLPPSRGVHADGGPLWRDFKLRLKPALSVLAAGRFTEIRPGVNDYDHCFRDWWLEGLSKVDGKVVFRTVSDDPQATKGGLLKYRSRLEGLAREIYKLVDAPEIYFLVRETEDLKPAA